MISHSKKHSVIGRRRIEADTAAVPNFAASGAEDQRVQRQSIGSVAIAPSQQSIKKFRCKLKG